jgi:hypothetical protein
LANSDNAVNKSEQLRDQQVQQQYTDQLGVYVQEKARSKAVEQRLPGWTPARKRTLNGNSRLRDKRARSRSSR